MKDTEIRILGIGLVAVGIIGYFITNNNSSNYKTHIAYASFINQYLVIRGMGFKNSDVVEVRYNNQIKSIVQGTVLSPDWIEIEYYDQQPRPITISILGLDGSRISNSFIL